MLPVCDRYLLYYAFSVFFIVIIIYFLLQKNKQIISVKCILLIKNCLFYF